MARPRGKDASGTLAGAGVGALVGGWTGAVVGAVVGTALNSENQPVSLQEAVRRECEARELKMAVFRRQSLYRVTVLFQRAANQFGEVIANASPAPGKTVPQIEDELYDSVVVSLDKWIARRHG
jgi:hypothetical protein